MYINYEIRSSQTNNLLLLQAVVEMRSTGYSLLVYLFRRLERYARSDGARIARGVSSNEALILKMAASRYVYVSKKQTYSKVIAALIT